jgi:hypothetical protein
VVPRAHHAHTADETHPGDDGRVDADDLCPTVDALQRMNHEYVIGVTNTQRTERRCGGKAARTRRQQAGLFGSSSRPSSEKVAVIDKLMHTDTKPRPYALPSAMVVCSAACSSQAAWGEDGVTTDAVQDTQHAGVARHATHT